MAISLTRRVGGRSLVALFLTGSGMAVGLAMQGIAAKQLGAGVYGIFSLIQAALVLLASLCPLGWLEGIPKYVAQYTEKGEPELLWGVARTSQLVSLLGAVVVSLLLGALESLLSLPPLYSATMLGTAVLLPAYCLSRLQQQILLTRQRLVDGLLFVHLVAPLIVISGLWLQPKMGLLGVLALYFLGTLLACLAQGVLLYRSLPRPVGPSRYDTREWSNVTRKLVAGILLQRVMNQCDLLILAPFASIAEVGNYSLARRLVDVVIFANQALASALAPMLGVALLNQNWAQAARLMRLGCLFSTLWAAPWVFLGVFFSEPLFAKLGSTYSGSWSLLQIVLLGAFVNAATGPVGQALLVGGHERFWRGSTLLTSSLGLAGYLITAPTLGVFGVAWVRSLYMVAQNVWRWTYLIRVLKRRGS